MVQCSAPWPVNVDPMLSHFGRIDAVHFLPIGRSGGKESRNEFQAPVS